MASPGDGSSPGARIDETPIVRDARATDGEVLSRLAMRSKAHWGYPDEFLAACRGELTYDERYLAAHRVFIVEVGGRVAGFCTLESLDDDRVELGGLFVEPGFIGTGLGRALMRHALAAARAAGARIMVIHGDPNARPFYEASGAVEVGRVPSASVPGRTLPMFEIDLRANRPIEDD
jgi:GNAT superfamily N-acetyltransferase